MIQYDHYFHDGASPENGWDVLERARAAHPGEDSVTLNELIAATSSSPPDAHLAVEALQRSGAVVEDEDEEQVLEVDKVIERASDDDEDDDDPEAVLEEVDEQVESVGVHTDEHHEDDEDPAEVQRRDALAIEFAAGSPAVLYLREISKARC